MMKLEDSFFLVKLYVLLNLLNNKISSLKKALK